MTLNEFCQPMINDMPFVKAAFQGFAGTGKSYTAAKMIVGLYERINAKHPVYVFDTEQAAKSLKPVFAESGIELMGKKSRNLYDLNKMIAMCEAEGAEILFIDSITQVWESFVEGYRLKKEKRINRNRSKPRKARLAMNDWAIIKPEWRRQFTDPFLSANVHIIFTSRIGYTYEHKEDDGATEIITTGVKMKTEGESAYEPDLIFHMERHEDILNAKKKVWRTCTPIKDRSTRIDGQTVDNPGYEFFSPAIEFFLAGDGSAAMVNRIRNMLATIPGSRELKKSVVQMVLESDSWKQVTEKSGDDLLRMLGNLRDFKKEWEGYIMSNDGEIKEEMAYEFMRHINTVNS